MRIALFTDTFFPVVNGVANVVYRCAQRFSELGHSVCVCTVSGLGSAELAGRMGRDIPVYALPSLSARVFYKDARVTRPPFGRSKRLMADFRPDVIHTHTPLLVGMEAIWSAEVRHVPLVGTHHTFYDHYLKYLWLDYPWARRLSWTSTVWYYNHCDVVISPTHSLAEGLTTHGLKRTPVIVPNPVDTESYRPASGPEARERLRAALGLSGPVLIYMGRVSYEKSIDQLIKALALVVNDEPAATLLVIGDGPDRARLERMASSLGLADRVRFTGYLFGQHLIEALQAGDLFVLGSKSENMPLAVLEAMAAGLPTVAVSSLGMTEIVRDGDNGVLLPPDQPRAMASAIVGLIRDPQTRNAMAARSRQLSMQYSHAASAESLLAIYAEAIGRRR
jgi:glycosyltransferase involved in cell wall biosynthesis